MAGETDLSILLASMSPSCDGREYVYCGLADSAPGDLAALFSRGGAPWALIREREGVTAIIDRADADALGLSYGSVFAKVTLEVHSSLDAVGLTAAASGALAERGISANVVAALYHDHFFVPFERRDEALAALADLAARAERAAQSERAARREE